MCAIFFSHFVLYPDYRISFFIPLAFRFADYTIDTFFNATDFMEMLIREKMKVVRFPITGYWIDIGKHEDYKKAQELVKHL